MWAVWKRGLNVRKRVVCVVRIDLSMLQVVVNQYLTFLLSGCCDLGVLRGPLVRCYGLFLVTITKIINLENVM